MRGALSGLRIRAVAVVRPKHRAPAFSQSSGREFADAASRVTAAKRLWFHNKEELVKPIGITWSRCTQGSTHVHRASSCSASLRMGCTARVGPHTFIGSSDSSFLDVSHGVAKDSQHHRRQKVAAVAAAVISSGSLMQLVEARMARLGIEHAILGSALVGMASVCFHADADVTVWFVGGTWIQSMPATVALFGLSDLLAQTIEKR